MRRSSLRSGRLALAGIAFLTSLAACANAPPSELLPASNPGHSDDPTKGIAEKPGAFSGGQHNTFDHMSDLGANGARDPFEVLSQRQEEGPAEIRTRMHSCQKIPYFTLQTILTSFGVDLDRTGDPPTAGQLVKSGGGALGVSNYDARVGESIVWTAAGAAKVFDIFVQAAPEIIANLPDVPQCQVDGVGPMMFDENDHCNEDAVTCLIGRPATKDHLAICDSVVESASDVDTGKKIAVATLLSAAHSCE